MSSEIKNCIAPDRNPRKPNIVLPKGSVDTHVHVFDQNRYTMSPTRGYNPPDSTLDDLKHLHTTLGVDRVVFTQPSTYGVDNAAIMDGMRDLNAETPNRARAIIATTMDITDDEIAEYDAAGARGIRLNKALFHMLNRAEGPAHRVDLRKLFARFLFQRGNLCLNHRVPSEEVIVFQKICFER